MRRSGPRRIAALLVVLLGLAGCRYGYNFSGGGLPLHIRTAAVLPFENETPMPDLQREFADMLRVQLERRLGLRPAAEGQADAVVRGSILRYEPDVPIAYSADPAQANTARRRVSIVVDVEIVDRRDGSVLWSRRGLRGEGEYAERAEDSGRQLAIERIVNDVIDGAQSQW